MIFEAFGWRTAVDAMFAINCCGKGILLSRRDQDERGKPIGLGSNSIPLLFQTAQSNISHFDSCYIAIAWHHPGIPLNWLFPYEIFWIWINRFQHEHSDMAHLCRISSSLQSNPWMPWAFFIVVYRRILWDRCGVLFWHGTLSTCPQLTFDWCSLSQRILKKNVIWKRNPIVCRVPQLEMSWSNWEWDIQVHSWVCKSRGSKVTKTDVSLVRPKHITAESLRSPAKHRDTSISPKEFLGPAASPPFHPECPVPFFIVLPETFSDLNTIHCQSLEHFQHDGCLITAKMIIVHPYQHHDGCPQNILKSFNFNICLFYFNAYII